MISYILIMKGHNSILFTEFSNSYYRGKVTIGSVKFFVTPKISGEVTCLKCEGEKVEWKGMEDYSKFKNNIFEGMEHLFRIKSGNEYDCTSLPYPFSIVFIWVMHYFTLEG